MVYFVFEFIFVRQKIHFVALKFIYWFQIEHVLGVPSGHTVQCHHLILSKGSTCKQNYLPSSKCPGGCNRVLNGAL